MILKKFLIILLSVFIVVGVVVSAFFISRKHTSSENNTTVSPPTSSTTQEPTIESSTNKNPEKITDPHHHLVDVEDVMKEIRATFKLVLVDPDIVVQKENPCPACYSVVSPDKTLRAFTTYESGTGDRIFIEETQTKKIFEIQGLPLPYRPFSGLVWINNHILVFDRWSQPHYGIHYAVDFSIKTLLIAAPYAVFS
ncbi:hypothetical protein A2641_01230 [Candidatus Nomurabacteria bacterium RIFCSPHIGHO2_01_FULL_37_25]|uniref:Uncharacterized protein n=1 Tax=Candidatus Nomurabacteria bacterium RIFCSPLOWO2_01_FULL_36_16 TaxID=1801767 RepID=A0A1F6WYZ1_9BACT|nr:MAG: hypothetical protein A2641_01230 [Candidatus Nomurabacteria bacterium RIFCSPHIGHO2_01_FULL_37_25]OGI75336.1 MAG: hypothetical protein A3D36_02130 [Candidatus Nomurabacteria bacterium RIFCSPHIGHO2_02_FULL_36_29]OGI87083.1 MAG: hypothetical protein A3A91_00225 [Candidatus Nomurabacteria bacterium RIFCSPLOWO2_01_FULL_36_16]OGI95242.1 MAG: hypothetical protein A3I84_02700 [Candidatus Nomurabacteria bacterium RIFCSPLOWO2_02_FULL_36_8]